MSRVTESRQVSSPPPKSPTRRPFLPLLGILALLSACGAPPSVQIASTALSTPTTRPGDETAQVATAALGNRVIRASGPVAWDNLAQEGRAASGRYTASFRIKGAGEVSLRIFEGSWGKELLRVGCTAAAEWKTCTAPLLTLANPAFTFNITNSGPASTPSLIDDVKLLDPQGKNVLQNSDFEAATLEPWWSGPGFVRITEPGVTPPPPPPTAGGPYRWKNVEVGGGGMVTGISVHPRVQNLVYVRTDVGGLFKWNEAAGSWAPLFDGFGKDQPYFNVESLATDPSDPQVVYAAAGNGDPAKGEKTALLKSTDQGQSWTVLKTDLYMLGNGDFRTGGERLAVDPNRSGTLYFGSRRQGLWRSENGGGIWTQVPGLPVGADPQGVGWVAFDPTSGTAGAGSRRLWVGIAGEGVFQSDDAGKSWRSVFKNEIPGYFMGDVSVSAAGNLYASFLKPQPRNPGETGFWVDDGNTRNGVYRLQNGAWDNISPDGAMNFDGVSALSVGGKDRLLVTPWDTSYQWRKPFSSEDGGRTWARIDFNDGDVKGQEGWLTQDFQAFGQAAALDPFNPERAWALGGFGVWRTDNYRARDAAGQSAARWTTRSRGIAETVDITAKSLPNGRLVTGVSDLSGFVYTNLDALPDDRSRHQTPLYTYTSLDALPSDPEYLVAAGQDQINVWNPDRRFAGFSTNGGYDWQRFPSLPQTSQGPASAGRLALGLGDKQNIVWAHAGPGVYASLDGGKSWTLGVVQGTAESFDPLYWYNGAFSNTYLNGEPLAADKVRPKTFYAYGNIAGFRTDVYRSSDGGLTWKASSPFSDGAWEGGTQIRTAPGRAGEVWIARGDKGLWRSTDGAVTFSKFAGVSRAQGVTFGKAAPGRSNPTVFLAGVVNGVEAVWRSDDEGKTWVRISDEREKVLNGNFFNIEGDVNVYGQVYIVTGGRGTFYGLPR
jgi:xyloglucan-specific exo-beta-1,4-glucanase